MVIGGTDEFRKENPGRTQSSETGYDYFGAPGARDVLSGKLSVCDVLLSVKKAYLGKLPGVDDLLSSRGGQLRLRAVLQHKFELGNGVCDSESFRGAVQKFEALKAANCGSLLYDTGWNRVTTPVAPGSAEATFLLKEERSGGAKRTADGSWLFCGFAIDLPDSIVYGGHVVEPCTTGPEGIFSVPPEGTHGALVYGRITLTWWLDDGRAVCEQGTKFGDFSVATSAYNLNKPGGEPGPSSPNWCEVQNSMPIVYGDPSAGTVPMGKPMFSANKFWTAVLSWRFIGTTGIRSWDDQLNSMRAAIMTPLERSASLQLLAWAKLTTDREAALAPDLVEMIAANVPRATCNKVTAELWPRSLDDRIALELMSTDQLKEKGNATFRNRSYAAAVLFYSAAIDRAAEDCEPMAVKRDLLSNRAASHAKVKAFELALQDAESAIELDPSWVKAYVRKADAQIGLKIDPLPVLQQVLLLDPAHERASDEISVGPLLNAADEFHDQGNSAFRERQYDQAVACYQSALDRLHTCKQTDAIERLRKEALVFVKEQKAHLNMAACHIESGCFAKAEQAANAAIQSNARIPAGLQSETCFGKAHYRLARAREGLGQHQAAIESVKRALDIHPSNKEATRLLGQLQK